MQMPIDEFKREDKTAVSNAPGTTRREKNLAVRSSPEARRAHLEIDAYREPTDDWHALFETPADRTRAEHATFLNGVSQEARDLYERGATIYGDTLIIPRETVDSARPTNQIRIGSLTFAVRQFTPIVGEEKAKEKAIEFVGLGRDIAGRTADGDTLLTVFREFYNEVKKDEHGRLLSHTEQTARLDTVLAGMRELADAMREQEWTREPIEFISLNDWERAMEAHQRDAEGEINGRLTHRLEEGGRLLLKMNGKGKSEREPANMLKNSHAQMAPLMTYLTNASPLMIYRRDCRRIFRRKKKNACATRSFRCLIVRSKAECVRETLSGDFQPDMPVKS